MDINIITNLPSSVSPGSQPPHSFLIPHSSFIILSFLIYYIILILIILILIPIPILQRSLAHREPVCVCDDANDRWKCKFTVFRL